jgi:hypothetical protein
MIVQGPTDATPDHGQPCPGYARLDMDQSRVTDP